MKRTHDDIGRALDRLLARHNTPSPDRMHSAVANVRDRLRSEMEVPVQGNADVVRGRRRFPALWVAVAGASAVVVFALSAMLLRTSPASTNTIARTNDESRQLTLADGSRVEMRPHSALRVERASDGLRIHLDEGAIIVNAAKQGRSGHLHVQTKDLSVSVVGTVFLVKAEQEGSRVAVIEGEVRVQRGPAQRTLRPGEQVTTSERLEALAVREEIASSRDAGVLVRLLQTASQNAPALEQTSTVTPRFEVLGANPRFEVASIRPCESDIVGNRGGPVKHSPGRFTANCQTVMGYIEAAYRLFAEGRSNPRSYVRIVGGPGWIQSARYTITATAPGDPSRALMAGPMLQALLEERFQLKVHREVREIPVYELRVTSGGHKLQPFKEGSCTPVGIDLPRLPEGAVPCAARGRRVGQHMRLDARRTTLEEFAWVLSLSLGRPVIDRTGITGVFDALVEYTPDESNSRLPPPTSDEPATAPTLFTAVQEQLGLKLEAARGPGEFIVIDAIERPTEN